MLSFDQAIERILGSVVPLASERVPLAGAAGRVLAEDLVTSVPLPPFDGSERDGYALNTESLRGEPPFRLVVAGEQRAGGGPAVLPEGMASRIFTGAALPQGANAVVMQEDVERDENIVVLKSRPAIGAYVRTRGEDLPAQAIALRRGTRLGSGALALAAMLGVPEVAVARKPRVTFLPNGDELRLPGEPLRHGEIYESNTIALAALARQAGADVIVLPIVRDDRDAMQRAIERALSSCELLVTIGGVSVGDHDVVRPALATCGVVLDFWKIAIRPGKPLAFGHRDNVCVLSLPGNPASALVTFGLFGLPLLRALQGDVKPRPQTISVRLSKPAPLSREREHLARSVLDARSDGLWATPLEQQAAGAAVSLAVSDGLVRLPLGEGTLPAGDCVTFIRWSDL